MSLETKKEKEDFKLSKKEKEDFIKLYKFHFEQYKKKYNENFQIISKDEVIPGLDDEEETKKEEVITGLDEEEENIYVLFDDRKIKFTRKMTKDCSFLDAIFDTEEKMCRLNKEFKYCTYDNMIILKQFLEIENNDFPNDVFNFDETLEKTLYKRPEALSFISTVIKDEQVLDLINLANYLGSNSFCMFLCYRMRSIINKENISYIKTL